MEGMPQLICLCFLLAFVIVDMSLGKQDHPYNKETTMHENSNKLPVQCLTWNFNTGVLEVLKVKSNIQRTYNSFKKMYNHITHK